AQKIFGPTLFAEGMLITVTFGLAAAFTAAAVRQLTGSMTLAILAALIEIAVFPRTYSYPKIVAYACAFWLYGWYLKGPSLTRVCAMAAGVAIAFMFRHDHGLFLGIGAALTILLSSPRRSPQGEGGARRMHDLAACAGVALLLILPYLLYVQVHGGLLLYFRNGVEFSQREAARQWHVWPRVFGDERPLESAMVYELYAIPVIALVVLAVTRARTDWKTMAAWVAPVAVVALLVDFSFIRDPLNTRLADAIVPAVVVGSWLLWRVFARSRVRPFAVPLALAFVALMGASVLTVGSTWDEIDRAGLLGHRQDIPKRFGERTSDLTSRFVDYQMPTRASRLLVPFFRYVDRCTRPDDRLLVGGFLVEVPFYAQRLFAAGQEYFGAYFSSEANERFAFDRLQRQRVPFVIMPSDSDGEFDSFRLVAGYVHAHFTSLSDFPVDEEQTIHIFVNRDLPAASRDAETGWPCFS
ncbi:MAG TPA: hypothetical protein VEP46_16735, partial [Vicinamibacterales bacterium]|nr:hypothetical protein [Vicinamibacterales bacterium]